MDSSSETTTPESINPDVAASKDAEVVDNVYLDDPKSTELSSEFVGRWANLVSTTNWEKGKIIAEWRDALIGSESPATAYSDEAWCRRVGGVTAQHVGRLRRVYERFGSSYSTYPSLFWSHFLAALDWDDAEMWLEGAAQSKWSISEMRRTRWQAQGGDPEREPKANDVVSVSEDEDYTPLAELDPSTGKEDSPRSVSEGPRYDDPDFGDEDDLKGSAGVANGDDDVMPWEDEPGSLDAESPFAKLPSLPVDMAEALEQFKLAIIRHRSDSWAEVSKNDVLSALEALKQFTMQ